MPKLLFLVCALSIAETASASVMLRLQGRYYRFHPSAPALVAGINTVMPRARVWEDSKSLAYRIAADAVAKLYTGPRYQDGDLKLEASKVRRMGEREATNIAAWAEPGLALPVLDTGAAEDGALFHAVYKVPARGTSAARLVRQGRYDEIRDRLEELTAGLVRGGFRLGTFNPTQVYLPTGGKALLIKSYTDDELAPDAPKDALAAEYERRARFFAALSDIYPRLESGDPVADAGPVSSLHEVARLTADAMRHNIVLRVVHQDRVWDEANGRPGEPAAPIEYRLLPSANSLYRDDFMKGYFRALDLDAGQQRLFRLDRVLTAEIAR